ncbi:hypothetical protein DU002_07940 [Corallincola holothuriorum]|uniref:Uncharacterized protein n=1 Tax=Corallincola holothuriorum TaxID=2282215 RepID=A0A368NIS5_9GAMM|nr:hypothetical protein [Corallincola holothuriorum]RCU50348.1 hypothetical protein DU002_07940 [Corallincola holothuriorum]
MIKLSRFVGKVSWLPLFLVVACCTGCAQLEQWTKPTVQGLVVAPSFTPDRLVVDGIDRVVVKNLASDIKVNPDALSPEVVAVLRDKRNEIKIKPGSRYVVHVTLLSNSVTKRTDDLDPDIYKYVTRTVKVNYVITDSMDADAEVWSGIIETSDETSASYKREKKQKKSDKVLDAVIESMTKSETYPYPEPPVFDTTLRWNFEGFALNLP